MCRYHFHSRSSRLGKRVRIRGRWRPPNTYIHQGRWRVHKFGEDHGSKFLNVFQVLSTGDLSRPILQLKKREVLLPLSFLITKPIKLDLWNLHYGPHYEPHYRTQGCVIRENNITAPITNPIKDPIKGALVPLRTNFNANGSVQWCTYLYLNLFHWPMGKKFW